MYPSWMGKATPVEPPVPGEGQEPVAPADMAGYTACSCGVVGGWGDADE